MTQAGTFRVYFNRHGAAPLLWCVALETTDQTAIIWEVCVRSIVITVPCQTMAGLRPQNDDDTGTASAWIQASGLLTVFPNGTATIVRAAQ